MTISITAVCPIGHVITRYTGTSPDVPYIRRWGRVNAAMLRQVHKKARVVIKERT